MPFKGLANKFTNTAGKIVHQHSVTVLSYPTKMIFDLVFRVGWPWRYSMVAMHV